MTKTPRCLIAASTVLLAIFGCSDVDNSPGSGGTNGTPGALDVAGEWQISETAGNNTCGESGTNTYTLTVTQNGNNLSVSTPVGTFTGTINGNTIVWSGSYPEEGGTVNLNVNITVAADGSSLQGSSTFNWSDGSESCSGATTVQGTRLTRPNTPSNPNEPMNGQCIEQGNVCSDANPDCCPGGICTNFGEFVACAGECTQGSDCQSGCCAPLEGGGSVCGPTTLCEGGGV